ncbi:rhodanese-like domain-containing protein [Mangrovivirga sp. M17]|uniref:Rhodanese-like domain-containing protein n=1 Tax=Mangrovivirga halotolerans TaxID=2993936 RepID=A0ABT3RW13_9BACT|nr:rhodanese-like domain-containing protein [Mangrovivirga halotolerans]MCX2745716.1 rhodanese-like domain-containing protein [Mangrovivirga halotolerans]
MKSKILIGLIFFMGIFSSNAQSNVSSGSYNLLLKTMLDHSVEEINVDEALRRPDAVFLDTRSFDEYAVSHIPASKWIGFEEFDIEKVSDLEKSTPIIVYCSIGYRSEKITEKLVEAGFTNIYNLYGGIFEWVNRSYPIVDSYGNPTDQIHAYSRKWGVWLSKGEKIYQ